MQVILDTNILLLPFTANRDIFSEIDTKITQAHELCVVQGTIDELQKIKNNQRGKDAKAADVGLQLIKAKDLKIIPQLLLSVDEELVRLSGKGIIIATLDKELRDRIKEKGGSLLIIRENQVEMI